MFNRTTISVPLGGHSTVNVKEHRAPTDESVKLLRDMEHAVEERMLMSVSVGDTKFECVVQAYREHFDDTYHLAAVFSLNGHRMQVQHVVPSFQYDRTKALHALRDKMATEIATVILSSAMGKVALP